MERGGETCPSLKGFMKKIIAAIIFLIPLSGIIQLGETDLWYSHYFFSSFFLFIFLAYNLRKFNLALSLFLACVVFSSYFVASHHPRSFLTLVQLMGFSYLAYLISTFDKSGRDIIVKALMAVFSIQAFMMTLQFFNIDPIFNSIKDTSIDSVVGLSASPNQFGLFMADMGVMSLFFFHWSFVIALIGVILSKTSFAFVGLTLGSLLYLFISNNKAIILIAVFIALVGGLFLYKVDMPSETALKERWRVWYHSIKSVEKGKIEMVINNNDGTSVTNYVTCNPWTGFGFGNFMRISPYSQSAYLLSDNNVRYSTHVYEHAHNDYVEVYFDTGRVGFLLMSFLIWNFFCIYRETRIKTLRFKACFCAIVAHLISALGIYTVHTAVSGMMLAVLYGLYIGESKDGQTSVIC